MTHFMPPCAFRRNPTPGVAVECLGIHFCQPPLAADSATKAGAPSTLLKLGCLVRPCAVRCAAVMTVATRHQCSTVFQAWFDEMWRFDLRAMLIAAGALIEQTAARQARSALGCRHWGQHVHVRRPRACDTWRYDFAKRSWSLLVPHRTTPTRKMPLTQAAATPSPPRPLPSGMFIWRLPPRRVPHRHPHASPLTEHACTLKHFESPHRKIPVWQVRGLRPLAFNDLWFFSTDSITWKRLPPTRDSDGMPQPVPAARVISPSCRLPTACSFSTVALCAFPAVRAMAIHGYITRAPTHWAPVNATDPPTQCVCVTFSPSHARFPSKRHLRLPLPVSQPLPPECGRARARRCHLLIRRRVVPAIHVPQRSESPRATASHCTADDRLRRRTTPRSQRP